MAWRDLARVRPAVALAERGFERIDPALESVAFDHPGEDLQHAGSARGRLPVQAAVARLAVEGGELAPTAAHRSQTKTSAGGGLDGFRLCAHELARGCVAIPRTLDVPNIPFGGSFKRLSATRAPPGAGCHARGPRACSVAPLVAGQVGGPPFTGWQR